MIIYIDYEPESADYLKDCDTSATYGEITSWVQEQYNVYVTNYVIAQVKDK